MQSVQTEIVRFKPSLPFRPEGKQVVYVEPAYEPGINEFLRNNYGGLRTGFANVGYEFCYFPCISRRLGGQEFVRYYTPYRADSAGQSLGSDCLRPFVKRGYELAPSLLLYGGQDAGGHTFHALRLKGHEHELRPLFDAFFRYLNEYEKGAADSEFFCATSSIEPVPEPDDFADMHFPEEVMELIADVSEKIRRLRQYGVNDMVLRSLLQPQIKLSRLRVTSRGQILLPDYGNLEIRMTPLVKAVYFLFLRHPEGLVFKSLPDFRRELYEIYSHLSGRDSGEAVMRSIMDVTDPCKNSINEKCARIREAFVREFDDRLAEYYYVTGGRGCTKRVRLPRELVEWDL